MSGLLRLLVHAIVSLITGIFTVEIAQVSHNTECKRSVIELVDREEDDLTSVVDSYEEQAID